MKRRERNRFGLAFAQALKRLRESKGLSQEQLAKRSGVPLRSIRMYERGTRDTGLADLIVIAIVLGVDAVQLFEETARTARH